MNTRQYKIFIIALFLVSLAASAVSKSFDQTRIAFWAGMPALVLSGWAMFGHLITLDDEFPGSWSNPDKDSSVFLHSLRWLALEAFVFALSVFVVFFWP